MINVIKKIANDMQKELDKLGLKFDVNYMNARVDALNALVTTFDNQRKQLKKVNTDYIGCIIVSPNIKGVYSKPGTKTFDGGFTLVFFVDHKQGNAVIDAINTFVNDVNGLYLIDLKDNQYEDGSLESMKGIRRKYKTSIGIDGVASNGSASLYQTYSVSMGVHLSDGTMGDDYVFNLINKETQEEILVEEIVRTDLGGDDTETNTEESNQLFGTLITGSMEKYTFTRFVDITDPFVNELLDIKTDETGLRLKYALKREIKGVNANGEYVALRTDLYDGKITNVTQVFDKGREALISFYYDVENLYNPPASNEALSKTLLKKGVVADE